MTHHARRGRVGRDRTRLDSGLSERAVHTSVAGPMEKKNRPAELTAQHPSVRDLLTARIADNHRVLSLLRSPAGLITRRGDGAVLLALSLRILVVGWLRKVQQRHESRVEARQRSPQPVREAEESVRGVVNRGRLELAVGALSHAFVRPQTLRERNSETHEVVTRYGRTIPTEPSDPFFSRSSRDQLAAMRTPDAVIPLDNVVKASEGGRLDSDWHDARGHRRCRGRGGRRRRRDGWATDGREIDWRDVDRRNSDGRDVGT